MHLNVLCLSPWHDNAVPRAPALGMKQFGWQDHAQGAPKGRPLMKQIPHRDVAQLLGVVHRRQTC